MTRLAMLTLTAALGLSAETYTGTITDDMCGRDHAHMGIAPDAKCVRECVKGGSKYALQVGDKVYKLSDQKLAEQFAAKRVKVTGKLYAKTGILAVEKIEAAK